MGTSDWAQSGVEQVSRSNPRPMPRWYMGQGWALYRLSKNPVGEMWYVLPGSAMSGMYRHKAMVKPWWGGSCDCTGSGWWPSLFPIPAGGEDSGSHTDYKCVLQREMMVVGSTLFFPVSSSSGLGPAPMGLSMDQTWALLLTTTALLCSREKSQQLALERERNRGYS